jgi:hypothetical protein
MEDELFGPMYALIQEEARRRPRPKRVQFSDGLILAVAFWAVLHDRPRGWACQRRNWPVQWYWLELPCESTLSVRLRTLSVQLLLEQVLCRMLALSALRDGFCLCRRIDSKPLPVGGFSKDRDARWGHAAGGAKQKGYRSFFCWGKSELAPEALTLGPMNQSDQAGGIELVDRLLALYGGCGRVGGYVLADSTHDTNPLYAHAGARGGLQLLAPRKQPHAGLGQRQHSAYRLRGIELLEGPRDPVTFATNPAAAHAFGPTLYRWRRQAERDLGNLGSFGGGLQPLPSFVRRPRRVALWVIAKLIINAMRICRNHGLTP